MPVRLWRCVCVWEGLDMYARNAGWRIIELYNNLGWNRLLTLTKSNPTAWGGVFWQWYQLCAWGSWVRAAVGKWVGKGLSLSTGLNVLLSRAALLQHQAALFWGEEGVMETPVPLVLEEALSWSPFANDWDYPNLNVVHSIWCKCFSRKITEFNSAWPNFTSCGAFIYQRQIQCRRNLPWNSKVLKCSAYQLLSTSVKGSQLSGPANLMDLCSSLKIFPTHVTAYPVQIFLQAF